MLTLLSSLDDITHNIEIDLAKFYMAHSSFGIEECSRISALQLKKIPSESRKAYFRYILVEFIYKIYFKGYFQNFSSTNEIDWDFYERVDSCNSGKGWLHPSYHVIQVKDRDTLVAEFDNGFLEVQKNIHLPPEYRDATVGDPIAVYLPNSFIDGDKYLAHGDFLGGRPPTKIYRYVLIITFNFSAAVALSAMALITKKLNEYKIMFRFQVLLDPNNYKFLDSGVLKIFCEQYEPDLYKKYIFPLLQEIYQTNISTFCEEIPIFSKKLAPGIGLFERHNPGMGVKQLLDSEWSYCEYVANGLIDSHTNNEKSSDAKMLNIMSYFNKYGIDIDRAYVNPDRPDIYTPIV